MSDTLLIHYDIRQPNSAVWSHCNAAGELVSKITDGSLSQLSETVGNQNKVVLLHSQCLHINQVQLPTQNAQKLLKAAPYAIEEFIAKDIDDLHFVISKNKHNKNTSIVGIDKQILKDIIATFTHFNISVETIIADATCLPANDKQWACLKFENEVYLQTDVNIGMVYDENIIPFIFEQKLTTQTSEDESKTFTQILPDKILFFDPEDNLTFIEQLKIDATIKTHSIAYNTHPLVIFCENYKQGLTLNLLQHEFKHKRKNTGFWQYWRVAASLAIVWLVANLLLTSFQSAQLEKDNKMMGVQIEKIYKKSFPKSKKIVNPRVQMEQKLDKLRLASGNQNKGLLFILGQSFAGIKLEELKVKIQSLRFKNNRMDLNLEGPNLQAIENINREINKQTNIKSVINSSSSEKEKVSGELRVETKS